MKRHPPWSTAQTARVTARGLPAPLHSGKRTSTPRNPATCLFRRLVSRQHWSAFSQKTPRWISVCLLVVMSIDRRILNLSSLRLAFWSWTNSSLHFCLSCSTLSGWFSPLALLKWSARRWSERRQEAQAPRTDKGAAQSGALERNSSPRLDKQTA